MGHFASGVPRLFVLALGLAVFRFVPAETLAKGPDLCLWRNLLHVSACPACGSTRALAAFFHGQFAEALAFNPNVVLTAPLLLGLVVADLLRVFRRVLSWVA